MAVLKTTWHHARRTPYQAFAAVFIMMQTFFIITIFTLFVFGSARVISYVESLPQVMAFFKPEAKQDQIDAVGEKLKATGKISRLEFVSQKEALQIYREQNKDEPLLSELVDATVLPSSYNISTHNIADLSEISSQLQKSSYIQKVIFPKDVIANLTSITNALRKVGIIASAILALDAIFIMIIIVGIKISQRREEIEIMRLLGATNWYIRWPFILEGMMYGVLGAIVGWIVAMAAFWYTIPFLTSFLRGIPIFPFPIEFLAGLLGVEIIIAILLGSFSSFLAVLRYLK